MQALLVALIVAASFVYAAWTLMPQRWRRPLAQRLLRWPAFARLGAVQRAARAGGGCCGCDDCGDAVPKAGTDGAQAIRIVRTPPR